MVQFVLNIIAKRVGTGSCIVLNKTVVFRDGRLSRDNVEIPVPGRKAHQ